MFNTEKQLPNIAEILEICPLSAQLQKKKALFDAALKENMRSRKKLTTVIGPCSADDPEAIAEYAEKLRNIARQHPNLLTVVRVYTSKPHSNGEGYLGRCFQINRNSAVDISEGIVACRKMMISVLQIGFPIADELLYPELFPYFSDLVSYWFLGARSGEDSLHRAFASGLDLLCGVKNPTGGLLESGINNVEAVSRKNVFPFAGKQIETDGNKFAHLVLRGGCDRNGYFKNISSENTALCKKILSEHNLNDFLMADISHANSAKIAKNQLQNAREVASDKNVDGVMAESYLRGGVSDNGYGISKTDDCLDIFETETLMGVLSEKFAKR